VQEHAGRVDHGRVGRTLGPFDHSEHCLHQPSCSLHCRLGAEPFGRDPSAEVRECRAAGIDHGVASEPISDRPQALVADQLMDGGKKAVDWVRHGRHCSPDLPTVEL
jgi:hypothetical protein